jgi:hypothetical protein
LERIYRLSGKLWVLDMCLLYNIGIDVSHDKIWTSAEFSHNTWVKVDCIVVGNRVYIFPRTLFSLRIMFWLKFYEGLFSSRNCTVKFVDNHITFTFIPIFHKSYTFSKPYEGSFVFSVNQGIWSP